MSADLTQSTWFGVDPAPTAIPRRARKATDPNPALAVYGPGPDGATCGTCQHLQRPHRFAKTYRKCALRGDSYGPGTDHYASWPACGRYVEADSD